LYFKEGKVKVEVGVAKGKKMHDKREDLKKKDLKREHAKDFKKNCRLVKQGLNQIEIGCQCHGSHLPETRL